MSSDSTRSLLGARVPHVQTTFLQSLSYSSHPWAFDHHVQGAPILPATAYLVMAMEAMGSGHLSNAVIQAPVLLHASTPLSLMTTVDLENLSGARVAIHSQLPPASSTAPSRGVNPNWMLHASAYKGNATAVSDVVPEWCGALQRRCITLTGSRPLLLSDVYARLATLGLDYANDFRLVSELRALRATEKHISVT